MFDIVELIPSIVLDIAKKMPETGLVTSPVIPKIVPFKIPIPPSS